MMNEMKEMMRGMMQEMMMETMKELMVEMLKPEVANAAVVEEPKVGGITRAKDTVKSFSREEWLAMAEAPKKAKAKTDYEALGLDIEAYGNKMVRWNMPVDDFDIIHYTNMVVAEKYNGKTIKYKGEWVWSFDEPIDRKNFLQCFQVKTSFTAEELAMVAQYRKNKKIASAERFLASNK